MTTPRMRAGNADRQAAADRLTRHFTDGRLDAEEFDQRVGRAYAATYLDELPALFTDLPEGSGKRGSGLPMRGFLDPPGQSVPDRFPERWAGPPPPAWPRALRILPVLAVFGLLALVFSLGAVTHGLFPFPLIWLVLMFMFIGHRRGRRRYSGPPASGYRPGHRPPDYRPPGY